MAGDVPRRVIAGPLIMPAYRRDDRLRPPFAVRPPSPIYQNRHRPRIPSIGMAGVAG